MQSRRDTPKLGSQRLCAQHALGPGRSTRNPSWKTSHFIGLTNQPLKSGKKRAQRLTLGCRDCWVGGSSMRRGGGRKPRKFVSLGFEWEELGCPGNFAGMSWTLEVLTKFFPNKTLFSLFGPCIECKRFFPHLPVVISSCILTELEWLKNGWKWLKMTESDWKWLKVIENDWEWLDMIQHDWEWLKSNEIVCLHFSAPMKSEQSKGGCHKEEYRKNMFVDASRAQRCVRGMPRVFPDLTIETRHSDTHPNRFGYISVRINVRLCCVWKRFSKVERKQKSVTRKRGYN